MYVGVALNGVLIYPGAHNGQNAFNPVVGTPLNYTVDHCLGYADSSAGYPTYRYYSYSPCILTNTLKSSNPYLCGGNTDCKAELLDYA